MAHHGSATAQTKRKCPEPEAAAGIMCAKGCGFHGAAATGDMCSKCYREHLVAAAASGTTAKTRVFIAPAAASTAPPEKKPKMIVSVESSDAGAEPSVASETKPPAAASRCAACRKKVGLLGFRCRCEGTFCSAHRYSEKHHCGFDHKTAGQEKIAEQNPVVVADKMAARI